MKTDIIGAVLKSNNSAKSRSLRTLPHIGGTSILSVPAGMEVRAVKRYEVETAGEAGVGSQPKDVWWEVPEVVISGVSYAGYMAEIHKGEVLMTARLDAPLPTPDPEEPPPAPPPSGLASQYIVTVDEATRRVIVKRGDGLPMPDWTAVIG